MNFEDTPSSAARNDAGKSYIPKQPLILQAAGFQALKGQTIRFVDPALKDYWFEVKESPKKLPNGKMQSANCHIHCPEDNKISLGDLMLKEVIII